MQYLSDEWIEAADSALAKAWASTESQQSADLDTGNELPASTTVGYSITAAPQGKAIYHVFVGENGAGVAKGKPEGEADATMELDYDTATQIARGETSPQVTFMQGRLKLGGDVTLLIKGAQRLNTISSAIDSIPGVEY